MFGESRETYKSLRLFKVKTPNFKALLAPPFHLEAIPLSSAPKVNKQSKQTSTRTLRSTLISIPPWCSTLPLYMVGVVPLQCAFFGGEIGPRRSDNCVLVKQDSGFLRSLSRLLPFCRQKYRAKLIPI